MVQAALPIALPYLLHAGSWRTCMQWCKLPYLSPRPSLTCPHAGSLPIATPLARLPARRPTPLPPCRQVPASQRGTLYWLQECLRLHMLIPPSTYGQPAFRPMPYALPLRQFENIRWACGRRSVVCVGWCELG